MGFWIFMFVCNILIPVIMIIFGRIMWKHVPKKINGVVGYRTAMSMKNMDTWRFAHEYCGKLWWKTGWNMLAVSVVVQLPFVHSGENTVGILGAVLCLIQCTVLVVTILPVEKALKRTFDQDGNRKQEKKKECI